MDKMMKKGAIAAAIILIAFLIYQIIAYDSSFNRISLSDSPNQVHNHTNTTYLDTLAHAALQSAEIDGVLVNINPSPAPMRGTTKEGLRLDAFVVKSYRPDTYYLYLNEGLNKREHISALAHEMVHIKQYQEGFLEIWDDTVVFKGDTTTFQEMPYGLRAWERDAFKRGPIIEDKIIEILYN